MTSNGRSAAGWDLIRENCGDIAAEAKELNEKRYAQEEARQIEDAKAILSAANEAAE